jgi:CHAD domain-containing protein
MALVPISFSVEDTSSARRALELVAQRFPTHWDQASTRQTTYYDTLDWRIFRSDQVLFAYSDGRSKFLRLDRADGTVRHRSRLASKPGFVWELPAGPLREELQPIVELRRLLALFTVEAREETLNILDERQKTVARIRLETPMAHPARGEAPSSKLAARLVAMPVRGYDTDFDSLIQLLTEELQLGRTGESEYRQAATAAGLEPGDYSPKVHVQLDPSVRADESVKTILRHLLTAIRANEEGIRRQIDSECLHDFRVAVRRTRSALTQIKGIYPWEIVDRFKAEFSWLGQITGRARDLDVYQLKMREYRAALPEHMGSDLGPLQDFLDRHQQIEYRELGLLLDTERYGLLLRDWQKFLDLPIPSETDLPEATTPILELASRRIWKSYRRVLKKGNAITPDTPPEALHRLRIECKKLRYLLEFFRSLFKTEAIGAPIKALKELQDNLGDFNDLEIQQATLRQYGQAMVAEQTATAESLMAMGRLVDHLERRQLEERQLFHRRFPEFASRQNRERFRTLFKPQKKARV